VLPPDDRVVLLDQLRPPLGYTLDAAVATTFTLDLAAALVPPLAFASFEMRGTADPVAALEAVRSCADRVDVFCQAGNIRIPAQASDLMAYLEPMVHEVRRPRPGFLFHPKVWFLRYTSPDLADQFRLLCSTRNLTNDRSWDAVVRLDGEATTGVKSVNHPLSAFLRDLPELSVTPLSEARSERIASLASDARFIEWDPLEKVRDIQFYALGIGSGRAVARPDFTGYRHLIVSPFCNDEGLAIVAPTASDVALVSRPEEIDRLSPESLEGMTTFRLDPLAGLADPDDATATPGPELLTGLHAKIVVVERNRAAHVFIGSANATSAAYGGNVEFVVELTGGASKIGVETFLGAESPFRGLLEPYSATGGNPADPADEEARALDNVLRDAASGMFTLTVDEGASGFTLRLASGAALTFPSSITLKAELITRPGHAAKLAPHEPAHGVFPDVPLADISPFIALRATTASGLARGTVVRATLFNDPPGRLDEILARQVDTPEKFLRFLALLLGLADPSSLLPAGEAGSGASAFFGGSTTGVLELILRALADHPQALRDLDRLVARLQTTTAGSEVLPKGFTELWDTVMAALRQSDGVTA
jgi:hypothetical protein